MYLYQVNIEVDESIKYKWIGFMKEKHLNDLLKTGCFVKARLLENDENPNLFTAEYFAETKENIKDYLENYAEKIRIEHTNLFENKFQISREIKRILIEF